MKNVLTIALCFVTINMFSQSDNWNKEEKNGVYLECVSVLEKYELTDLTAKENLCLCYLDKVTENHSFHEYSNKIDVVKNRLIDNNIQNCATNLDISLTKGKVSKEDLENEKADLIPENDNKAILGIWSFEKGTFSFYQDYEYKYEGKMGKCRGKWSVTGNFLDIDSKICSDEKFELVKIENDEIIMYRVRGRKLFHLKREK